MSFAFTATGVIITGKPNAKGVAPSETIPYVDMPKGADRAKSVQKAISADAAASSVALSYFLEAATSGGDILAFAGYATMRNAEGMLTQTLKPESEELKKSRSAFNKATREALAPIVKADLTEAYPKKGAQWVAEEWSAMLAQGSFAQCISTARKYVAYTGKLPCAYTENGTPDIARGLSVYAMQQVCKQYAAADHEAKDESIAARIGTLYAEYAELEEITEDDARTILARLDLFAKQVREDLNSIAAQVTETTEHRLPQEMTPDAILAALAAHAEAEELETEDA